MDTGKEKQDMTQGDVIRAMNDDQLIKFLEDLVVECCKKTAEVIQKHTELMDGDEIKNEWEERIRRSIQETVVPVFKQEIDDGEKQNHLYEGI